MFTGIVEDIGTIKAIQAADKDKKYSIETKNINISEIKLGDSISVNGACLTVMKISRNYFDVDVSSETLSKTNLSELKVGSNTNLERSIKLGERMGGHIVTGHIDGVGKVKSIKDHGKSKKYCFEMPNDLKKYLIVKGSIALDGVSLTINEVDNEKFSVNIIPFTQLNTTFSQLKRGDLVNVECDVIGKYIEKLMLMEGSDSKILKLLENLHK